MTVSSSELSCSGSWTVRRCPWSSIFWIWLVGWQLVINNALFEWRIVQFFMAFLKLQCLHCVCQLEKVCYIIAIFPSSFISLIRSSHTNVDDKDENPTLASLKSFPVCPIFLASLVICISAYVAASMLCTALSPAWPSYWCLCCGGHLERCPAAAHEHCLYPRSPYSSAWQGCQPRLLILPGWAMVSNCQCLCTSSAERDGMFRLAGKLTNVFIFTK